MGRYGFKLLLLKNNIIINSNLRRDVGRFMKNYISSL